MFGCVSSAVQADHTLVALRLALLAVAVLYLERPESVKHIRLEAVVDESAPQQLDNGVECGMFAMKAMEFLSGPGRPPFDRFPSSAPWLQPSGATYPWQLSEMPAHRRTFFHQLLCSRID